MRAMRLCLSACLAVSLIAIGVMVRTAWSRRGDEATHLSASCVEQRSDRIWLRAAICGRCRAREALRRG